MDGKITAITKPDDDSVKKTLQEMVDRQDLFQSVIIIANNKNGSQFLKASRMSDMERSVLFCLFQAYITDLFRMQESDGE